MKKRSLFLTAFFAVFWVSLSISTVHAVTYGTYINMTQDEIDCMEDSECLPSAPTLADNVNGGTYQPEYYYKFIGSPADATAWSAYDVYVIYIWDRYDQDTYDMYQSIINQDSPLDPTSSPRGYFVGKSAYSVGGYTYVLALSCNAYHCSSLSAPASYTLKYNGSTWDTTTAHNKMLDPRESLELLYTGNIPLGYLSDYQPYIDTMNSQQNHGLATYAYPEIFYAPSGGNSITWVSPEASQGDFNALSTEWILNFEVADELAGNVYIEWGTSTGVYDHTDYDDPFRGYRIFSGSQNITIPKLSILEYETTYYARACFEDVFSVDDFCEEEISFTTDEYTIPEVGPTSTSTESTLSCDPDGSWWEYSWCNLYLSLFKPSQEKLNNFTNIKELIINKPPMGYVFGLYDVYKDMEVDEGVSDILTMPDPVQDTFVDPLREFLHYMMIFACAIYIITFISKHL